EFPHAPMLRTYGTWTLVSPLLGAILLLSGCLTLIEHIHVPAEVAVDESFVVAVDGAVIGHGGGMVGLVLQVPESFDFDGAFYVSSRARRVLRGNAAIAAQYEAEEGHRVFAVVDSIRMSRDTEAAVRVLLRFTPRETGQFQLKFISGVSAEVDGRLHWRSTDPGGARSFADTLGASRAHGVRVVHPERNGTAALELGGARQYLAFPASGMFPPRLASDFTLEFWLRSTACDIPLLSARPDDFATAFPCELRIAADGSPALLAADGRTIFSSDARRFIADGVWHHLAASWCADSLRFTLYVDGDAVDTLALPPQMRAVTAESFFLGSNPPHTQFARGQVEELRIWETCRSVQEIAYYKDLTLSGYETALAALFSFDVGSDGRIPGQAQGDSLALTAYNRPRLVVSTTPLRIELLAFYAVLEGDTVRMNWETYDESKVEYYEVEKRTESGRFAVIERIAPLQLVERHQNYLVIDTWRGRQVAYYRLRKVNLDGTVLFSEEVPIGIEAILNFSLEDNVPNPFSEGTEIRYTLSKRTRVELTVYDMMGKEVATLVSERQEPGDYAVTFEAEEHPAGMYFYKMRTSAGSQTKKMYLAR
ncbi:MAG: LamG-like jellyroll fold domain-containing protein, partial [Bacteroidota bacterium]|nr:LamG-like jellyroll fold domain-containing protein [Bacteroidota bacterium]